MNSYGIVLLIAVLTPFVVYVSVKLGTFAYYKAKEKYEENRRG